MFQKVKFMLRYFKYLANSRSFPGHKGHSPFLSSMLDKIIFLRDPDKKYSTIFEYTRELKKSKLNILVDDKGAGRGYNSLTRKISTIARKSATRRKYGKLLARLVGYFNPSCIIELGTSLGVGTSYLSLNLLPGSRLFTIEGSANLLSYAEKYCQTFQSANIMAIKGDFDEVLPDLLKGLDSVDMAYVDGNHREEPTIRYFECLLPKLHNDSVLIFDDIHWSIGMEKAWSYIKSHPSVHLSLDLFQVGIVFFKKEWMKEDLVIRF
jgi:predicted O-methyltransferase YrrM